MRRHKQPWGRAIFMAMSFSGVLVLAIVALARFLMMAAGLDLVLRILAQ